ncbi:hypothetical protein ACFLQK_02445 [bacterium]
MRLGQWLLGFLVISIVVLAAVAGGKISAHPHRLTPESALEAVKMTRVFLEEDPDDYILRYDIGEKLMIAGKLDESEKELRIVLEYDPDFGMAWVRLAEIQYFREKYDYALELLKNFKSKDEIEKYEYLVLKTSILIEQKEYEDALKTAEEAAAIDQSWFYQPDPRGAFYESIMKKAVGKAESPVHDVVEALFKALEGFFAVEWYSGYIERFFTREEHIDILEKVYSECHPDAPVVKQIKKKILELQKKGDKKKIGANSGK